MAARAVSAATRFAGSHAGGFFGRSLEYPLPIAPKQRTRFASAENAGFVDISQAAITSSIVFFRTEARPFTVRVSSLYGEFSDQACHFSKTPVVLIVGDRNRNQKGSIDSKKLNSQCCLVQQLY
ncbi:unnamed protein product [Larinioides sclopetarius]|uniref:Uncharacterized protein n=1 Tax=Larinioides sclopetarius TaxID=280406 RepID=A0AAV2BJG6_9ARAC